MKVTFRYDLSDAHRVGELVAALAAGGFVFEAEFLPVLPVPVQEEVLQEPELPTEMVQPLDYAAAQGAVVEAVLPDSKPSNWDKLMQIYFAQSKYDRENPKPRRTPERI